MRPRVKNGLIYGLIGAVLNICVAAAVGICGPFVSLLAGGLAGYFTVQQEKAMVKGDGARTGAMSGAIAGAMVLVGQLIGALVSLAFIQSTGSPTLFGAAPAGGDAATSAVYYASGLGVGFCIGLFGVGLAAAAGAAAGYFGTSEGNEVVV